MDSLESLLIELKNQGYFPTVHVVEDINGDMVWKALISYGPTIHDRTIAFSEVSPLMALGIAYEVLKKVKLIQRTSFSL